MPDRMSDDGQWYEGSSAYMRVAPKVFVGLAVLCYVGGLDHWIQVATMLVGAAFVHSRWLPWRFEIQDDGLLLRFPFGRTRFLSRSLLTVSVDLAGAIAYDDGPGKHWLGYPLRDGLMYQPGRESVLRAAFVNRGYTVT